MATTDLQQFTDDNFADAVLGGERPALVEFSAVWCGPCRALEPLLASLAARWRGRVSVGKLDVDTSPEVPARYGITSVPSLLLFKEGRVVAQLVGLSSRTRAQLEAALAEHAA